MAGTIASAAGSLPHLVRLSPGTVICRTLRRRAFSSPRLPRKDDEPYRAAQQVVERWRPGDDRPEVLDREIAWQPAPDVAPLVIDLPAMFTDLWGES